MSNRTYSAHNAIDDLETEIEYLEEQNKRLRDELKDVEQVGFNSFFLKSMIKNLYIAKTSASEREFEMQLREMFMKVLDKRL
jgi:uncharacterized protein (UPF0335 family)